MSYYTLKILTETLSQRTKGDKRGHFDVLHPSARSPWTWRGLDQRRQ